MEKQRRQLSHQILHLQPSPITILSPNLSVVNYEMETGSSRISGMDETALESSDSSGAPVLQLKNKSKAKSSKRQRAKYRQMFKKQWLKNYPWLLHDQTDTFKIQSTV